MWDEKLAAAGKGRPTAGSGVLTVQITSEPRFPFTAIVGQTPMKRALLLNAINTKIGGVLIRGKKGTAKSTAVRPLAALLPEVQVFQGCPYSCPPEARQGLCHTGGDRAGDGDPAHCSRLVADAWEWRSRSRASGDHRIRSADPRSASRSRCRRPPTGFRRCAGLLRSVPRWVMVGREEPPLRVFSDE